MNVLGGDGAVAPPLRQVLDVSEAFATEDVAVHRERHVPGRIPAGKPAVPLGGYHIPAAVRRNLAHTDMLESVIRPGGTAVDVWTGDAFEIVDGEWLASRVKRAGESTASPAKADAVGD